MSYSNGIEMGARYISDPLHKQTHYCPPVVNKHYLAIEPHNHYKGFKTD